MKKNEMDGACGTYGGTGEVYTEFWWGDLRERDHLEGLDVDGSVILKWVFREWDGRAWSGLIWLRIGTGECGNELAGCIRCREFLE
jgi:hypothetical protein